ncbi:MAG: HD domain-containing phosphohydrolase [Bryobacteraceae bacterium]|jgi:putative two-component system response regulator
MPEQLITGVEVATAEWEDSTSGPPAILIVDDNEINRRLIRAMLKTTSYHIVECHKAVEALKILLSDKVDLVILDLMLPEMGGPEFCRRLKADRRTRFIPVLMMTSVQGFENEVVGITSGADEFLTKPLHPAVLRARIRSMLRNKALIDSLEEAESILFALAQAVEQRDQYTGLHCQRLATYSVALGEALGLSRTEMRALYRGGYMHDIGKIGVPDAILFKRGALTDDEWVVMRSHTTKGEEICRPMKSLAPVLPIIRSHHERWDGSGYPDGRSGEDVPLLARVLQIADIYDALTTSRSYKAALTHEEAAMVMMQEVEKGWRDPELVSLFLDIVGDVRAQDLPALTSMQVSLDNMRRQLTR